MKRAAGCFYGRSDFFTTADRVRRKNHDPACREVEEEEEEEDGRRLRRAEKSPRDASRPRRRLLRRKGSHKNRVNYTRHGLMLVRNRSAVYREKHKLDTKSSDLFFRFDGA